MGVSGRIVAGLMIAWAMAVGVGLLLALMPILLALAGFLVMIGLLALIGGLVARCCGY